MKAFRTAPVILGLTTLAACGGGGSDAVPSGGNSQLGDAGDPGDAASEPAPSFDAASEAADDGTTATDAPNTPDAGADQQAPEAGAELSGYIGSGCTTAADCPFDGATCLTDGFPNGLCTQACTDTCPDQSGQPVTFCGKAADLPEAGSSFDGLCLSRCDFGYYPDSGCRAGYGCVKIERPFDSTVVKFACLPNRTSELSQCYYDLAARGVGFEPTVMADESPDGMPQLVCHVQDPLYLKSPVHGVQLRTSAGTATARVLASCPMAGAVVSTIDDVAPLGVVGFRHMGTYNCRVIAGTTELSQHSFGAAIDIAGFDFDDGHLWTVLDDWEHDTAAPQTDAGKFLYAAAHRWFDAHYWNIILTPNYNADHDDHFHVDLTQGSHFLGFKDGRYIGPAPYAD